MTIVGGFLRSIAGIWLYFIGPGPITAQADTCLVRTIAVNVEGLDRLPVSNLQTSDFEATVRGNTIDVARATYEKTPRRLLILLDVSNSMTAPIGEWDAVLGTVIEFAKALPAHISPGVMIFADGTQLVAGFDESRATVLTKIAGLAAVKSHAVGKFTKHTAMFDAIAHGLSLLAPAQFGDVILLVTDADDDASMEKAAPLQRQVLESGIRIFGIIGFPKIFRSFLPYPLTDDELRLVPDAMAITGGHGLVFRWEQPGRFLDELRNQLRGEIPRLIRDISESYKLELNLRRPISRFENFRLSIRDRRPDRKDFNLLYPHKLAPCN
jgi:hypothetical protein